jgi:hypothetical protein
MTKPSNLRIEDVAAATARGDLNDILISLASLQTTDGAGTAYTGEPTTTYPNMLWYDKATSILKVRSTDDSTWINAAYIDQSNNAFRVIDDTQVVNTSGTQTGLIGDQANSAWQAGVGTVESLVSPAKIKAAIDALTQLPIGVGQTWQTVSRSAGVSYQNTTGRPIQVVMNFDGDFQSGSFEVSTDNVNWITVFTDGGDGGPAGGPSIIIPNNYYYRANVSGGAVIRAWVELR